MELNNLDDLKIMLATAESGSLTAAGQRCALSTAAVSSAIKRLENTLGVRLFERTTRVVRPTAAGLVMIEHARQALEILAQGQAQAGRGQTALQGVLRVTVSASMAHAWVAQGLADFVQRHPGLELDLLVSDAQLDLVREGIDMALRFGPLSDSGHHACLVRDAYRVACASPAYLQAHGVPTNPRELEHHRCIIYYVRGERYAQWNFSQAQSGVEWSIKAHADLVCNDASIAQQWALQGRGILYASELAVVQALRSGDLVRLFPDYVCDAAPLYAVFPNARFVSAKVRSAIEFLSTRLEA
jgi:DNA-binding transcriptional LysR family regulator